VAEPRPANPELQIDRGGIYDVTAGSLNVYEGATHASGQRQQHCSSSSNSLITQMRKKGSHMSLPLGKGNAVAAAAVTAPLQQQLRWQVGNNSRKCAQAHTWQKAGGHCNTHTKAHLRATARCAIVRRRDSPHQQRC
jgi:hypothetical protein